MSPEYKQPIAIRPPVNYAVPERHSCDCAPACPDCGGLSCVCRPRFFAGQCLTDVELNGIMEYVRDRNRQQNRLFGTGVVCGLEVSCDPCGNGSVTVSPGHAISPCGEDIVVCSPTSVPVCDLINRCRERDPYERDCPPYGPPNAECGQREETWILYIRYAEQVSRPMTPLKSSVGCGCGGHSTGSGGCGCGGGAKGGCGCGGGDAKSACGCGGHSTTSSGGCGCGGSKSTKSSARVPDRCAPPTACAPPRRGRPYQPECEPTVVCETFTFSMTKVEPDPHKDREPLRTDSPFERCRRDLAESLPDRPKDSYRVKQPTPTALAEWSAWCCNVHEALRRVLSRRALHDCSLLERLRAVPCPSPEDGHFATLMNTAEIAFADIAGDLLRSCLCSSLLPPCPESVADDRVALATVVIRRDPCSVKSICNWEVRSVVLTPNAIMYWLGLVGGTDAMRSAVERLCCGPSVQLDVAAGPPKIPVPFAGALASVLSGGGALPMSKLVQALFGGQLKLTKQQMADPLEYVLAQDLIAPLARGASASWTEGAK